MVAGADMSSRSNTTQHSRPAARCRTVCRLFLWNSRLSVDPPRPVRRYLSECVGFSVELTSVRDGQCCLMMFTIVWRNPSCSVCQWYTEVRPGSVIPTCTGLTSRSESSTNSDWQYTSVRNTAVPSTWWTTVHSRLSLMLPVVNICVLSVVSSIHATSLSQHVWSSDILCCQSDDPGTHYPVGSVAEWVERWSWPANFHYPEPDC